MKNIKINKFTKYIISGILLFLMYFSVNKFFSPFLTNADTYTDTFSDTSLINAGSSSNYAVTGGNLQAGSVFTAGGDGADGACTVSSNTNINTGSCVGSGNADGVNSPIVSIGTDSVTLGPATTIDSFSTGTSTVRFNSATSQYGQSFTNGSAKTLLNATFYLAKGSSPTGTMYAKIYAHTGTYGTSSQPTGTALATSDGFDVSTITTGNNTFTFSGTNQITLSASTYYVVTLEYNGGTSTNYVSWYFNAGGHSGNEVYGTSWTPNSTNDMRFSVNGVGVLAGIASGDEVLLINLQGNSTNYANVGTYEFLTISSIDVGKITFTSNITNTYGVGGNSNLTGQKIMVQRVPNYTSVTINNGYTLTANAFDGTKGGVIVFKATGTVTVTGSISANYLGFRGGDTLWGDGNNVGEGGESFCGLGGQGVGGWGAAGAGRYSIGGSAGSGYCGGGGHGGSANAGLGSVSQGGAGGGAAGGGGGAGGGYGTGGYRLSATDQAGSNTSQDGQKGWNLSAGAGGSYGVADLSKMFFGSGGGMAGSIDGSNDPGPGGDGGGIIYIIATTLNTTGSITSNGQAGGNNNVDRAGGSGGGAGGSIKIVTDSTTLGTNLVTTTGGTYGTSSTDRNGGAGGVGRIRIEYVTSLSGTTNPSASASQTGGGGYQTSGTVISTNLLTSLSVGPISSFDYNLTSLPSGSSATVQFSQNGTTWYNSSGTLDGTNSLSSGSNNISLSTLDWYGNNIYYKLVFTTNGTTTFTLASVTINYTTDNSCLAGLSGNNTIYSDCSFANTYVNGDNGTRYIHGVETVGTDNTNTATLTLARGTLLIYNNQSITAGSFILNGGSIAINTGGELKPGATLWVPDADADGYPTTTNIVYLKDGGTTRASSLRRASMLTLSIVDCNDSSYNTANTCGGANGSPCTADIDCTSTICGTNADSDGYFSLAAGHTGTCQASVLPYTDCYDGNPNAFPGQTTYFAANRGDGSWDYNCDSSQSKDASDYNDCSCSVCQTTGATCTCSNPSTGGCGTGYTSHNNCNESISCGGSCYLSQSCCITNTNNTVKCR